MIESAIFSILKDNAAVGAFSDDRIYPVVPTQDTLLPYIVYARTSTERQRNLSGPSSLIKAEFTLNYWCDAFDTLAALGKAIADALDGYRGDRCGGDDSRYLYGRTKQRGRTGRLPRGCNLLCVGRTVKPLCFPSGRGGHNFKPIDAR